MHVYTIRIFVDDWPKACDFYERVLGLPLEFKDAHFGWAEFDAGGAKFGIERMDTQGDTDDKRIVGRFVGVSLKVDDAEQAYRELIAKGVVFDTPPEKQHWGGMVGHFKDPCGNILTLMSE